MQCTGLNNANRAAWNVELLWWVCVCVCECMHRWYTRRHVHIKPCAVHCSLCVWGVRFAMRTDGFSLLLCEYLYVILVYLHDDSFDLHNIRAKRASLWWPSSSLSRVVCMSTGKMLLWCWWWWWWSSSDDADDDRMMPMVCCVYGTFFALRVSVSLFILSGCVVYFYITLLLVWNTNTQSARNTWMPDTERVSLRLPISRCVCVSIVCCAFHCGSKIHALVQIMCKTQHTYVLRSLFACSFKIYRATSAFCVCESGIYLW